MWIVWGFVTIDLAKRVVVIYKGEILFDGNLKELVGQFAAKLLALKKPEPYKGKGMRYADEVIRRKQGKKSV